MRTMLSPAHTRTHSPINRASAKVTHIVGATLRDGMGDRRVTLGYAPARGPWSSQLVAIHSHGFYHVRTVEDEKEARFYAMDRRAPDTPDMRLYMPDRRI